MAQKDKSALQSESTSLFPDNNAQEITPARKRSFDTDMIDSNLNLSETSLQTVQGPIAFAGSVSTATNVYVINSIDDFPNAPVGNVIELTDGDEIAYQIASNVIDLGANVLKATGGICYIVGLNPGESELTSTSTSPIITADDATMRVEDLVVRHPNGDIFDFSGDGVIDALICDRLIVTASEYIGQSISGAVAASFNRCVFVSSTLGGMTFGADNSQLIFLGNACGLQSGFLGWANSLIDLGVATFDLINISGNRVFPGSGDTFLTGAANGANINSGGAAELVNNLFVGAGNSVTTITGQDDNWFFDGNAFNDAIRNTRDAADSYLTASQTVTIDTIGVYEFINGTNWASDVAEHFTVSSAGIIEYTGIKDIEVIITMTATLEKVGGGSDQICLRVGLNGTTQAKTTGCTQNSQPTGVIAQGVFTLSSGDQVRPYVANIGSTSNVIVSISNVTIIGNRT